MSIQDRRYTIPKEKALFQTKYKKQRTNYTISADLLHDFNTYCDSEALNRSAVIEKFIENFLVQSGVRKSK